MPEFRMGSSWSLCMLWVTIGGRPWRFMPNRRRRSITNIEKGIGKRMYERCLSWKEGDNMPDEKDLITSQDRLNSCTRRNWFRMGSSWSLCMLWVTIGGRPWRFIV
jgi:hypothetical protein